jgi:hypothetical protein
MEVKDRWFIGTLSTSRCISLNSTPPKQRIYHRPMISSNGLVHRHLEMRMSRVIQRRSIEQSILTLPSLHPSTYTTRLALRAMGNPVPNSPWWKKMIAAPPPKPGEAPPTIPNYPDYQADDTGGKGTTIIILDDGYDLSVPVSLHFHSGGTYPNVFRIYDYPAVACRMTSCPTITQCHHRTDFNGSMRI